jgi:hypothetical protein
VVQGTVLAWAERTGDRITLVAYNLETGDKKVLDEFGPFNPGLQSDGRYLAWSRGEEATGIEARVYDIETGAQTKLRDATAELDSWPSLDGGRVAWTRAYPPQWNEVIMVRDLPDGPEIQLTDSSWIDQPPSIAGDHIVWTRYNSNPDSSSGRGIFVATRKPNARSDDETSSQSAGLGGGPEVTNINWELDLTWSPPEALPDSQKRTICDSLNYYGVQALFPSPAPGGVGGPTSAGLWLTRTIPTNIVEVSVFVGTKDGNPLLSVRSGDSTWADSENWAEVPVRGNTGRFTANSAGLTFLTWKEGGAHLQCRLWSPAFPGTGDRVA